MNLLQICCLFAFRSVIITDVLNISTDVLKNIHVYDKNFFSGFLYLIPLVESVLFLSLCLLKAYLPNIIRQESNNLQNKYIY